jgi:hypothetical protein
MERVPNSSTRTEVGSSDVITRSRTFGTSVLQPAGPDGVEQDKGGDGVVLTPQDMGSTSSTQSVTTRLPPAPTAAPVADNFTDFTVWTEEFWNSSATPTLSLLVTTTQINLANDTNVSVASDLIPEEGDASCVEWEAAQHNLFQTANLFFAAAFIVPRSFKQSLLLLR